LEFADDTERALLCCYHITDVTDKELQWSTVYKWDDTKTWKQI